MTRLSWPLASRSDGAPGYGRSGGIFAPWHAVCCSLLLTGCLYLGPIPTLAENMAPTYTTNPLDGTAVVVPPAGQYFTILASDEEADDLSITWLLNGEWLGTATPVPYEFGEGSQVLLPSSEDLQGKTLTCLLDDGHGAVTLQWYLEVL